MVVNCWTASTNDAEIMNISMHLLNQTKWWYLCILNAFFFILPLEAAFLMFGCIKREETEKKKRSKKGSYHSQVHLCHLHSHLRHHTARTSAYRTRFCTGSCWHYNLKSEPSTFNHCISEVPIILESKCVHFRSINVQCSLCTYCSSSHRCCHHNRSSRHSARLGLHTVCCHTGTFPGRLRDSETEFTF